MKSFLTLALVAGLVSTANAAVEPTDASTQSNIQTESANVADVAPVAAAPKKWSVALESENYKAIASENKTYDGDVEAFQAIKAGYKLQENLSAQVVGEWTQRYGYDGQSGNNRSGTTFEDMSLRLTRSNAFTTGAVNWTAQGRLYVPTSEASQDAKLLTQARAYLIGGVELTKKLSAEIVISPRYYVYQDGNRTDDKRDWRILDTAALKYSLTDALAVETTLGVYSKKAVNAKDMAHFQDYSTSAYYTVNSMFSVNAGIRAVDGAHNLDKDGLDLYDLKASEYFGILTVSL